MKPAEASVRNLNLAGASGDPVETALWLARMLGDVIGDKGMTPKAENDAVADCYNQYIIAMMLRPAVDAKPFMEQVRAGITRAKDWKRERAVPMSERLALAKVETESVDAFLETANAVIVNESVRQSATRGTE